MDATHNCAWCIFCVSSLSEQVMAWSGNITYELPWVRGLYRDTWQLTEYDRMHPSISSFHQSPMHYILQISKERR